MTLIIIVGAIILELIILKLVMRKKWKWTQ